MNRLRSFEILIQVADSGSFNKAARALGISPQATSKAISALEAALGVRLFQRTTRQNRLTDDGELLVEQARKAIRAVDEAWEGAQQASSEPRGLVRVACGINVGHRILLPLIHAFQQRFPRIEVELIASDEFTDIVQQGIDVGFRAGLEPAGKLHSQRLFSLQMIACASPGYVRKHGMPKTRQDLSDHICTGSRLASNGRIEPWEFEENGQLVYQDVASKFWVNDSDTETYAVMRGMGIGLLANINIAGALRDGRLVPVLTENICERYGLYLYYPGQHRLSERARRFIDFVTRELNGSAGFYIARSELQQLRDQALGLCPTHQAPNVNG